MLCRSGLNLSFPLLVLLGETKLERDYYLAYDQTGKTSENY